MYQWCKCRGVHGEHSEEHCGGQEHLEKHKNSQNDDEKWIIIYGHHLWLLSPLQGSKPYLQEHRGSNQAETEDGLR